MGKPVRWLCVALWLAGLLSPFFISDRALAGAIAASLLAFPAGWGAAGAILELFAMRRVDSSAKMK